MSLIPFVVTKNSVVVLAEPDGPVVTCVLLIKACGVNVPIIIGDFEARSIVSLVTDGEPKIGSITNVLANLTQFFGASLKHIAITNLERETFVGCATFEHQGNSISLPLFPSEAILLALQLEAPMFIEELLVIESVTDYGTALLEAIHEAAPHALES